MEGIDFKLTVIILNIIMLNSSWRFINQVFLYRSEFYSVNIQDRSQKSSIFVLSRILHSIIELFQLLYPSK